ncbi:hypothetical protein BDW69DRAFT_186245, partial [Aspergillus filifer]
HPPLLLSAMARSKHPKASDPPGHRVVLSCPPARSDPPSIERTIIGIHLIRIYGWPSAGGLIVLLNPTRVDFDYLGWDILDPPLERDRNQDAEDEVCKQLLSLGATWYDSKARFKLLAAAAENGRAARDKFLTEQVPAVTRTESLWVRVGWPSTGGLWVVEFGDPRFEELIDPCSGQETWVSDSALVSLAMDMDQRCQILERLGGKFYAHGANYYYSGRSLLGVAVRHGSIGAAEVWLETLKTNSNAMSILNLEHEMRDNIAEALHNAIRAGQLKAVELLEKYTALDSAGVDR